ncbi:MAG: CDP-alcohol phosphatidyltransferase family protein [Actinomycetales bacterium]
MARASVRRAALPKRGEYFDRWTRLHGGYDPRGNWIVAFWLSLTYVVARPLAVAGLTPDVVTVGTAVLGSVAVVSTAAVGGHIVILTSSLVVLSALADNLDGALAVLLDRATSWGYVLDSVCDRVVDAAFLVALWVVGSPGWLVALCGGVMGLLEYARARAVGAGMPDIGVVTIGERPTRVIVTAAFLLGAGLYVSAAATWASLGAVAWLAVHAVALVQLLVVVRRRLSVR